MKDNYFLNWINWIQDLNPVLNLYNIISASINYPWLEWYCIHRKRKLYWNWQRLSLPRTCSLLLIEKKMKQGLCLVLLSNAFISHSSALNYEVSQILTPIFFIEAVQSLILKLIVFLMRFYYIKNIHRYLIKSTYIEQNVSETCEWV